MTKSVRPLARRDFLGRAWAGMGLLAALGSGYIGVRFLTSQPSAGVFGGVITAGLADDFPPNSVTAFANGKFYLARREDGGFIALYQKCSHLACVVLWHEGERQFFCPCHGSRFQPDGAVLNRPAARPLTRFPVSFDGQNVQVDTGSQIERDRVEASDYAYPVALEEAP